jgi:hypothetical protein
MSRGRSPKSRKARSRNAATSRSSTQVRRTVRGSPDDPLVRWAISRDGSVPRATTWSGGRSPEVTLRGDGNGGEIGHGLDVVGPDTMALEELAIVRNPVVGVSDEPAEPGVLEPCQRLHGRPTVAGQGREDPEGIEHPGRWHFRRVWPRPVLSA